MIQQLSVFVENEVGSLAKVTRVLRENRINLKAISSFDTPEFTIMRIVVDQPADAKSVLMKNGFAVKTSEAVAVELEDRPGELDHVLQVVAEAKLGINYIYSFVLRGGKAPLIVLNTENLDETEKLLKAKGFIVTGQEEIR